MAIEDETWTATGLDANMPTYRMLLTLCAYLFTPRAGRLRFDAEGVRRPPLHILKAATIVALHLAIGLLIGVIAVHLTGVHPLALFATGIAGVYYLAASLFFRSRIVIWLIRLYQVRAPDEIRAICEMTPCCSDYMALAIKKYGLIAGVSKGIERLRRCGPPAQIDYP